MPHLRVRSLFICLMLAATGLVFPAAVADATPITVDAGYYRFGWDAVDSHASPRPADAGLLESEGDPFTFVAFGSVMVTIVDYQASTERFEVFLDGASLGLSSLNTPGSSSGQGLAGVQAALADLNFSRMIFGLGAGDYSIEIILRDGEYLPGSGAISVTTAPVPEPGSLFLLGTGLVGLGRAWRKRRG